MPTLEAFIPHLPPFAMVLARFTGLFMFTPLLSSAMLPRRMRALLCFAFALVVYPTINHAAAPVAMDLLDLVPAIAAELLIGGTIGLAAAIPLMTAQLGGQIIGQQMGLGIASVINPAIDIEGNELGQILFVGAIATFIAAGGIELCFSALAVSFAHIPLLSFSLADAPLELLLGIIASGFEVSVRIAMPVLAILTLETVAIGFISRSLPALNVMAMGFPIRVLLGIIVVISSVILINEAMVADLAEAIRNVTEWITEMS